MTATVAARSGLEIVRYRDLIWLTVHRSKHTVHLRQLMSKAASVVSLRGWNGPPIQVCLCCSVQRGFY